jgi:hypothetical protein
MIMSQIHFARRGRLDLAGTRIGGFAALSPTKFEVRSPSKGLATMSALKAMCKVLDPPLRGFLMEECVQYGPHEPCIVSFHCVTNLIRLQYSIVIAELLEESRSIARGKELLDFVLYFGVLAGVIWKAWIMSVLS